MPLEPDGLRHLRAAEGYMELGMPLDANQELEQIDPHAQHIPTVLVVRLQIYEALGMWDRMQVIALILNGV